MHALNWLRKRCQRARHDRAGFTLVEVLVVLVILSIGIIPLAMVQTRARQEVQESDRYTRALTIAQREMEMTKGLGFAAAAPDSGSEDGVDWIVNVQDVDIGLRQVGVSVSFLQGTQRETLVVSSLLSLR